LVSVVNSMDRTAFSVLAPAIRHEIHLTDAELGLLAGFGFSLFYAVCGIPISRWSDRGVRRNLIALAIAVWSLMTALSGASQNIWQLFLARGGVGAAEAGSIPAAQSLICDLVPLRKRFGVFALHSSGVLIGAMAGIWVCGLLADRVGWRLVFVLLGIPGLAIAALVRLTLKEPVRGAMEVGAYTETRTTLGATVSAMWRSRTYRLLALVVVTYAVTQSAMAQWWPSFYVRTYDLKMSQIGLQLGLALGFAPGAGLLAGGWLANRLAARDVRLPLILGAVGTLVALPVVLATLFSPNPSISFALLGAVGVLCNLAYGSIVSCMTGVLVPHMRATAQSIVTFVVSLVGYGLGPLLVGVVSDLIAPSFGVLSLRYALVVPALLLPIMSVGFWMSSRHATAELAARSPIDLAM